MKFAQLYVGAVIILMAIGTHFGYLNIDVQTTNSTQVPQNATSHNVTSYNGTWYNTTELFAGNFSTGRLLYTMFGADPIWMVWSTVGFAIVWVGIKDRHHNYFGTGYHYHPSSSTTTTRQDEEDEDTEEVEDRPEAVSLENETLVAMKCPNCGAGLKFGDSDVADCPYCGAEVRRKTS
jgi:hypothetical protein